jgi:hypothetical protein
MSTSDMLGALVRKMGRFALPGLALGAMAVWAAAHIVAQPGERVSVLFGLVEYTKANSRSGQAAERTQTSDSTAQQPKLDTLLTLGRLSRGLTRWDVTARLGRPAYIDTSESGTITLKFFPLEEKYFGFDHAVIADFRPADSLRTLVVVTSYGVRALRNLGIDSPFLSLIGASSSDISSQFGTPEELANVGGGGQSPQFRLRNPRGQEARLRVLCDSLLTCGAIAIAWDPRNWARAFAK